MLRIILVLILSLLFNVDAEAKMHHRIHTHGKITHVKHKSIKRLNIGKASWYGARFHGRKTASGEKFNQYAMTAAHKTLPLGSIVRVTNLETNRSIIVRINDRGPYVKGRIIDLSKGAAIALRMAGSDTVELTVLD